MGRTSPPVVPRRLTPLEELREAYAHDELGVDELERLVGEHLRGEPMTNPPPRVAMRFAGPLIQSGVLAPDYLRDMFTRKYA